MSDYKDHDCWLETGRKKRPSAALAWTGMQTKAPVERRPGRTIVRRRKERRRERRDAPRTGRGRKGRRRSDPSQGEQAIRS